jgi:putative nucleotidyltransferase with HDIG domain
VAARRARLALTAVVVFSDAFSVQLNHIWVSASAVALAGAMVLLGPAPAVFIAIASQLLDSARRPRGWGNALANVSTFAAFALIGGVVFEAVGTVELAEAQSGITIPAVLAVYMLTNVLNFFLIAVDSAVFDDQPVRTSFREVYLPTLPADFAMGLLTAAAVLGYYVLGPGAIGLLAVISLTFQYLMQTVWESAQRGHALERRTRELSALQVGLLSTVLQTLSLRDAMTARHSAAVARYSREMAKELGLNEVEQDLVHTAGLLHDIGKFIFPDSILFAARRLTEDEFKIVRKHPEQGARLVQRIEGYGPVAAIIRAHHERIDGTGYPRRLKADQIPLPSRIISIADTYDVMTSRDSYRDTVSSEAAIAELRRVSGTQLDADIVEVFIRISRAGGSSSGTRTAADFEAELSFERRVRDYAAPRTLMA